MRQRKHTPASNFVNDLVATHMPRKVARDEAVRVTALAEDLRRGRITLPEFRAGLRGEA